MWGKVDKRIANLLAEANRHSDATQGICIEVMAKQNVLDTILSDLLAAFGATLPATERADWLEKLRGLSRNFNDPSGAGAFADANADELMLAAQLSRRATENLNSFVDALAARISFGEPTPGRDA